MYKICLVEDETDLQTVVKMYLEKAGYDVTTFTKGIDAVVLYLAFVNVSIMALNTNTITTAIMIFLFTWLLFNTSYFITYSPPWSSTSFLFVFL